MAGHVPRARQARDRPPAPVRGGQKLDRLTPPLGLGARAPPMPSARGSTPSWAVSQRSWYVGEAFLRAWRHWIMLGRNAVALVLGGIFALAVSPVPYALAQTAPAPAEAKPGASKPAPKPVTKGPKGAEPAGTIDAATLQKLKSGDAAQVRAALDDVRLAGKAGQNAAPAIAALLQRGLTSELTIAALDTLGDVEAESSSDAIAWYAAHRTASIRQ